MTNCNLRFFEDVCPISGKTERISIDYIEPPILNSQKHDYKALPGVCTNESCRLGSTAYCKLFLKAIEK